MSQVKGRVPEHTEGKTMTPHWGYLSLYLIGVAALFALGIGWSR